jgi:dCTP deaminase
LLIDVFDAKSNTPNEIPLSENLSMTILSDVDIEARMAAGELVRLGSKEQLGPACYELRMGTVYYDLTEQDKRIDVGTTGTILIKPGHRVVLITQEELQIPQNMIARVTSKGSLFSVGLSPVNTYADPGFEGNLGIVTQNLSDKYIEIPTGESIAKVDFALLSSAVTRPYRGQHGFQTKIWPIKRQFQKSFEEVKNDPRVESEVVEAYKMLPRATATALRSIQRRQRIVDAAILVAIFLNALVLALVSTKFVETTIAIGTNLISSAIIGALMWFSRTKE